MADFSYRFAKSGDHAVVVALLAELVEELGPQETAGRVKGMLDDDIRIALDADSVCIVLVEHGDTCIGLARGDIISTDPIFRLRQDHRCGYVDQMYVRPDFRGRKIGAELLRRCEQWFRKHGIGHSILHAAPKAVRFYARHGYQPNREMFKRL